MSACQRVTILPSIFSFPLPVGGWYIVRQRLVPLVSAGQGPSHNSTSAYCSSRDLLQSPVGTSPLLARGARRASSYECGEAAVSAGTGDATPMGAPTSSDGLWRVLCASLSVHPRQVLHPQHVGGGERVCEAPHARVSTGQPEALDQVTLNISKKPAEAIFGQNCDMIGDWCALMRMPKFSGN